MKFTYILRLTTAVVLAAGFTACDEGDIQPDEASVGIAGRTVRLEADLDGVDAWASRYSVVVAGFGQGNDYALIAKPVKASTDASGHCEFELTGIQNDVTEVALCAIDPLRRRVATFVTVDATDGEGTINITPSERIDVSMTGAVQTEIFDTRCVQCHGRTGHAAAGLDLVEGRSYASLVGVPSVKEPEHLRVALGNSTESTLWRALALPVTAHWGYDHSVEVVDDALLGLVADWIDAGAPNAD